MTRNENNRYGLKFGRSQLVAGALLLSAFGPVAFGGGYGLARWDPGANNAGGNAQNKGFWAKQKLDVGDEMTVTFTNNGNTIKNANGETPAKSGTVASNRIGLKVYIPGLVNGQSVTDAHQTHTKHPDGDIVFPSGTLEIAAFSPVDGAQMGLGNWFFDNGYIDDSEFTVPDFTTAGSDLFYGIDAVSWQDFGFDVTDAMFGTEFSVINGSAEGLPGIVFSGSAMDSWDGAWGTSSGFTGTVTLDSLHAFSIPTPGSMGLLGLGGLVAARRRR